MQLIHLARARDADQRAGQLPLLVKGIEHVGGMVGRALVAKEIRLGAVAVHLRLALAVHKELRAAVERDRRVLVRQRHAARPARGPGFFDQVDHFPDEELLQLLILENVVRLLHFRAKIAENALEIDLIRGIFRKHGGVVRVDRAEYDAAAVQPRRVQPLQDAGNVHRRHAGHIRGDEDHLLLAVFQRKAGRRQRIVDVARNAGIELADDIDRPVRRDVRLCPANADIFFHGNIPFFQVRF